MNIKWNKRKSKQLQTGRRLSLEVFAKMIAEGDYIAEMKNPARDGQSIYLCIFNDYVHVVPFVRDNKENIILKTVFPSRKYQKIYGGDTSERSEAG